MPQLKLSRLLPDFVITMLLWGYFLGGSVLFFFLYYLPAYFFAKNRAAAFQLINHRHMKNFFALTRFLIPRTEFVIDERIRQIRGAVIVCNHLSYLDPILLISLFPRQCTIIKSTFYKVPFFGYLLRAAGYIPSAPREMLGPAMIRNLEIIKEQLAAGANLIIFPEGTRSRDGSLAPFNKGVFVIARYCDSPLELVYIQNTAKLFRPGKFLFDTRLPNRIELKLIGTLAPDYQSNNFSLSGLADEGRALFEGRAVRNNNKGEA